VSKLRYSTKQADVGILTSLAISWELNLDSVAYGCSSPEISSPELLEPVYTSASSPPADLTVLYPFAHSFIQSYTLIFLMHYAY
jgi:hypothetical protein